MGKCSMFSAWLVDVCHSWFNCWCRQYRSGNLEWLCCQGQIFRKFGITFHAKFHTSHFSNHFSKIVNSHFTFLKSHFMFHFLNFTSTSISCILLCISWSVKWDLWNGKCEMRITFHVSHMPNVICETNMKREFKFSKNLPLFNFCFLRWYIKQ